ncbi:hypothetical protein EVAR_34439_1 [Eumeta japonica]|uniref:Uncharacterized protein n=1 Tax=Eumeta variegata TaxID=151549 RepID=A0A4C1WKK7_EUMVA|nr:hypothetical protein EVAR_34439_1 [Eumeta japonica]
MADVTSSSIGARGHKNLSLEEMKKLFFQFLTDRARSRESSPSPSVSSGKRFSNTPSSDETSDQSDSRTKRSRRNLLKRYGKRIITVNVKLFAGIQTK